MEAETQNLLGKNKTISGYPTHDDQVVYESKSPSFRACLTWFFLDQSNLWRAGAYTTTRTHNNGSHLLFWERHLLRLANSAKILFNSNPKLLFQSETSNVSISSSLTQSSLWNSAIQTLVNDSMSKVLAMALEERKNGEELRITTLLTGNLEKLDEESISRVFDVYIHLGLFVPTLFGVRDNAARLAVVGRGRDVANAKYSDWVRLRKSLEKLRPPSATELLLSNDGDRILEGCLTNFFVVCRKENGDCSNDSKAKDLHDDRRIYSVEIQAAPISDGVLPGVIRQVIIDICSSYGIPFREVAPSWSEREIWDEAFITNSLRLLQHVENIQVPCSWESLESKSWEEVTWEEKWFKESPGRITTLIQEEILKKAALEGYPLTSFNHL